MSNTRTRIAKMFLGCVLCASANCTDTEEAKQEGFTPDVTTPTLADSNAPINGNKPNHVAGEETHVGDSSLMAKQDAQNSVTPNAEAANNKQKGSWWDSILKFFFFF